MRQIKVHIVVLILALFVLGSVASSAMAHCAHDSFTVDDAMAMEMSDHNEKADASSCGSHDHGSASAVDSSSGHSSDHNSNPLDCDDCSGVPCQSQIQIPQGVVPTQCKDADQLHSKDSNHFKNIFLTIIPDPPNQIS